MYGDQFIPNSLNHLLFCQFQLGNWRKTAQLWNICLVQRPKTTFERSTFSQSEKEYFVQLIRHNFFKKKNTQKVQGRNFVLKVYSTHWQIWFRPVGIRVIMYTTYVHSSLLAFSFPSDRQSGTKRKQVSLQHSVHNIEIILSLTSYRNYIHIYRILQMRWHYTYI